MLTLFKTMLKKIDILPDQFDKYGGVIKIEIVIRFFFVSAECNKNITQASSPEGTICSPRYSHPYPADITCTYDFYANPGERVQIKFTHFNLHKSKIYSEVNG